MEKEKSEISKKPTKSEWKKERLKIMSEIPRSAYSYHIQWECRFCKHLFEKEEIYRHLFRCHHDKTYNAVDVRFHPFIHAIEEYEKTRG